MKNAKQYDVACRRIRLKRVRCGWYETPDGTWRAVRIDDPTHEGYGLWKLYCYDKNDEAMADPWPTLAHCRVVIERHVKLRSRKGKANGE